MDNCCEFAADCPVRSRRAQAARLAHDPKRKGELAELAFVLAAASNGLVVSKPYGESMPYDFIVQNDERLLRVQVKASFSARRDGYYFSLTNSPRRRLHRCYTEKEIDFLAAYVGPHDAWYIVPHHVIRNITSMVICPGAQGKQSGARFEIYREAWDLLLAETTPRKGEASVAKPDLNSP